MENHKDQIELGKIISQTTELPQATVNAFVKHLFAEIKNNLESGSSVNVGGLGIFRVIKSGDSNKILFLGSKKNITETIDPASFKEELEGKTIRQKVIKDILATSAIDKTHIKPSIPILKEEKPKKKDLVDTISRTKILTETLKADNLKKEESTLIDNKTQLEVDNEEKVLSQNTINSVKDKDNVAESIKTEINKDVVENTDFLRKTKSDTNNNDSLRKLQLNREEKKKGAIVLPIFIALLIIIAIFGVGYLFFENAKVDNNTPITTQVPVAFEELAVTDSVRISYTIIPDKDVSLEYIANHYYGDEIFWPYIYIENENLLANSTIVSAGSIIKVPKLMIDLANYNDGSTTRDAQIFGDEIKETRKIY